MQRLEPVIVELRPDLVLTYGDVNSHRRRPLVARSSRCAGFSRGPLPPGPPMRLRRVRG